MKAMTPRDPAWAALRAWHRKNRAWNTEMGKKFDNAFYSGRASAHNHALTEMSRLRRRKAAEGRTKGTGR